MHAPRKKVPSALHHKAYLILYARTLVQVLPVLLSPAGLHADWNDCLRLGKQGESSFVAMQLYYAMTVIRKFADQKQDKEYLEYLDKIQKELGDTRGCEKIPPFSLVDGLNNSISAPSNACST